MQWQELIDQFGEELYRTAYRVLADAGEAEDTVQDVLLEAFHKSEETEFSPDVPLLRRMMLLRAIDRLRRRKPMETLRTTDEAIVDHAPSLPLEQRELAAQLRRALSELPPQQAKVFALRYLEGLTSQEIAHELSLSASAVSSALHKARRSLQESLSLMEILEPPQ